MPQAQAAAVKHGTYDPDKVICRSEVETGSRLARKKVCRTAAQWKDYQWQQRNELERGQAGRPPDGN